jgi:TRAP-type C4-dicarboxylate transport system permease small subunit
MKHTIKKTERLVDSASLFLANVGAIILLGLVVLTCVDVIGRYMFNSPLVGAVELVRICMAGIIFFSFPLMFLRNDHIIVDLIPFFRRGWVGWVTAILTLVLTILVAEYLSIPRWPVVGFITVSIFLAAFTAAVRLLVILTQPGELPDESHEEGL